MTASHAGPQVSFVFTGRNDNYGGDFRQRLQDCVYQLYAQLTRFGLRAEIIFVNYNPLPEPEITDFIRWPQSTERVTVKIITVPAEIHEKFLALHPVRPFPVLEYLGKNTGIRRSRGEYVVCMNPDIAIPDTIIRYMSHNLDKTFYYKADRMDVELTENRRRYVRMNLKGHSFPAKKYNHLLASWWKLKYSVINAYKFSTPTWWKVLDLLKMTVYRDNAEFRYHCMAGGDFMLMHRDHWMKLGGYAEQNHIALHVDSLMTIQAAAYGLKEHVFGQPLIHREHGRRFTSDKAQPNQSEAYFTFQREAQEMLKSRKNKIYNQDDWGLIKFELAETLVT